MMKDVMMDAQVEILFFCFFFIIRGLAVGTVGWVVKLLSPARVPSPPVPPIRLYEYIIWIVALGRGFIEP